MAKATSVTVSGKSSGGGDLDATDRAAQLEQEIVFYAQAASTATWGLAEKLYEFHESGAWSLLGYHSLNDFLAQPELGISRSHFFRLTKIWRDLVVVRKVAPARLLKLEPTKVAEVTAAIMRGDTTPAKALADAESLAKSDLRAKYAPSNAARDAVKNGKKAPPTIDLDEDLEATDEPERVQCEACGHWYVPDPEEN